MNLKCEIQVSKFAFKFNLYHYNAAPVFVPPTLAPNPPKPEVGLYELNAVDP
jgi:hypothetical protein